MAAKKMQSKSEFVRSLPSSLSAAEVVKKAKAAGIKISTGHVYTIRSAANRAKGVRGRPGRKPTATRGVESVERQFVGLALDIGLGRARQLLDETRATVQRTVG